MFHSYTHPHSQHCVSLSVFVLLGCLLLYFVFLFSTVEIGVLSQFCYTCTCTCIKVAFHLISRFKDLKCLSKPDRAEVWGTILALLQEMVSERPAQPNNQVTPEPPTKKPTLMLENESSSDEEEDSIIDDCPQEWWSTHEGAHSEMAHLAH